MTMIPTTDHEQPKLFMSLETVEQHIIERARVNIVDFIDYISDGEHHPADHHLEWLYALLNPDDKYVNIIAPRGSAKTTLLVYVLAYLIGRYPLKTHGIFSANADSADKRLREVKDIVETNVRYRNVFPWVEIDYKRPNNASEFTVKSSIWKGKEVDYSTWRRTVARYGQRITPTLLSKGVQSSGIAGNRFTGLVLLDDIHDEKNSATSDQRAKVVTSVKKVIMPCMWKPDKPKMASICTRWAEDDYPGTIEAEKRKGGENVWKTLVIPAIDADGNSYWKEVWTMETLEETREEIGEVMFQLMFMLNPKAASSNEFTLDMLRQPLPNPLPTFKEVFISCDFADTVGAKSDYTVFSAVARDELKRFNYYILDIKRFKRTRIGDKIGELSKFCDEIRGYYGMLTAVLMEQRDSATEAAEFRAVMPETTLRIVEASGDKVERMKKLAPIAQQSRMYVNMLMPNYNAMCSELIGFPAQHDDIVDTLDLPFQQPSWSATYERVGSIPLPKNVQ